MFFLKELPTRQMIDGYVDRFSGLNATSIETALQLMRQASLMVREIDAYFAGFNFSQLRFLVLIVIDREPDRESLYINEISERLDISRPVMTRTLKSLIDDGFLNVTADDNDKRAKRISLTPSGHKRLTEMLPGYFAVIEIFMAEQS